MALSANLQFDKMEVDTKLAKDYIKTHKCEIYPIGICVEVGSTLNDGAGNKIYCASHDAFKQMSSSEDIRKQERGLEYDTNLVNLAKKIEDNVNLFCQLEYLIRQKSIQSTMLELKMIIKHLHYQASLHVNKGYNWTPLVMRNDSPLIDLGYIALLASSVHILAAENTAAVCYLFAELCQTAGIDTVTLSIFANDHAVFNKRAMFTKRKELAGGCIGVVTAQCDVDSAVDVLLSAQKGDLWGIRRILVQESASERFKTEFAWKTRSGSQADVKPELKSLCTDVYVHEEKTYLREYVGCDTNRDVVLIESFRTIQEMLALMESYSPFCVSLWSHGVAESNEIAFNSTAPMIWVNCYGILGDANEVSLAYFSQINVIDPDSETDKVLKLQKDWMKLAYDERYKRVLSGLNTLVGDVGYKVLLRCSSACGKNFAHVSGGYVVVGVCKPRELYAIDLRKESDVLDLVRNLLDGSVFLINSPLNDSESFNTIVSRLIEKGLPIHFTSKPLASDPFPLAQVTRIIHTNFGTIFTK